MHVAVDTPTILPLYHLHLQHSLNIKLQKMKLTLASLHLTNQNPENFRRILAANWNYSHLDLIIEELLKEKPNHDLYLYGTVESTYDNSRPSARIDDQAPIIAIIALPSGRVPTRTVGYHNNQTGEEQFHPFERFQFHWALAQDASYHNRVYYLACRADFSSAPEDGSAPYHEYEHSGLFIPTPRDINLEVDFVKFHFMDLRGIEQTSVWEPPDDPDLNAFLDEIMEDHFGDVSDDEDGSDDSDGSSQPQGQHATEEELAAARQNIRQVRSIHTSHSVLLNRFTNYDLIISSFSSQSSRLLRPKLRRFVQQCDNETIFSSEM